ncbi:MAG: helix-turn-helix domain-containing protein [Oscillospiraceae bacterium]|nr:helix-turn-helix domain-containing protein [Oscillospiraceae bacterium]
MNNNTSYSSINTGKSALCGDYLTTKQAADQLGLCGEMIRIYIRQGRLKAHKLGHRTIRIDPKDLQAFIEESAT